MTAEERRHKVVPVSLERRALPVFGISERFRPGKEKSLQQTVRELKSIGVRRLRPVIEYDQRHAHSNRIWLDRLLPYLAQSFQIMPSFHPAPDMADQGVPMRSFVEFVSSLVESFPDLFPWLEICLPHEAFITGDGKNAEEMENVLCRGVKRLQKQDKQVVLGSVPVDDWAVLDRMKELFPHFNGIGIRAFPPIAGFSWNNWGRTVETLRPHLEKNGSTQALWVTETGYPTIDHDAFNQIHALLSLLDSPLERVYWSSFRDDDSGSFKNGILAKTGFLNRDGSPKLLMRLLQKEGVTGLKEIRSISANGKIPARAGMTALVTGGAGFIGTNLSDRLAGEGKNVIVFDSLNRPGVEENLRWLKRKHGSLITPVIGDIRNRRALGRVIRLVDEVYHFAAQVAVTTSVAEPDVDFEVNTRGTLNLLEELRALKNPPPMIYTSTNKVYGRLEHIVLEEKDTRYVPVDPALRLSGISEHQPLDFYSPYGCSKGAADQYVLDYSRIYGLPTIVLRMSCIYGPHQFGTEDQGWVAHFLIRAIQREPLTIYGNGKQVRDILYVEDLVDALLQARKRIGSIKGQAFNIGGGPANSVSLLELLDSMEQMGLDPAEVRFDRNFRPGDQAYFVADTSSFRRATGWTPRVSHHQGVPILAAWLREHRILEPGPRLEAAL
ncbi:MAG: NAD-dependent epimerase/dehydratase family protein [Desulfovibrionales bacterium]